MVVTNNMSHGVGSLSVDPYKVLGLRKNFTERELKDAYKVKALKVHPDKGGSDELFQLVTDCFKALARALKEREGERTFHELKQNFAKDDIDSQVDISHVFKNGDKFDNEKFNKLFKEAKVKTAHDEGYEDFIKTYKYSEAPAATADTLNTVFEQHAAKQLVVRKDPAPQHLCSQQMIFEELGVDRIDDYSSDVKSNLQFCDLQKAITTVRLAPEEDKRKRARTMEQLQKERKAMEDKGFPMSEKEARRRALAEKKEQERESRRLQQLVDMDKRKKAQLAHAIKLAIK